MACKEKLMIYHLCEDGAQSECFNRPALRVVIGEV